MIIIYLETNSIMAIATGRNKELEDFVYHASDNLKFVIPSICLMESLVAIEREEKRSKSFSQTIAIEIIRPLARAKRNLVSVPDFYANNQRFTVRNQVSGTIKNNFDTFARGLMKLNAIKN